MKLLAFTYKYTLRNNPWSWEHLKAAHWLLTGKLGQYHVCIFDALTPIMNCYRRLGDPQGSLKYCQKVIHCMETVLDLPTVELGNFYKCMGEVLAVRTEANGLSQGLRGIYKKQVRKSVHECCVQYCSRNCRLMFHSQLCCSQCCSQ